MRIIIVRVEKLRKNMPTYIHTRTPIQLNRLQNCGISIICQHKLVLWRSLHTTMRTLSKPCFRKTWFSEDCFLATFVESLYLQQYFMEHLYINSAWYPGLCISVHSSRFSCALVVPISNSISIQNFQLNWFQHTQSVILFVPSNLDRQSHAETRFSRPGYIRRGAWLGQLTYMPGSITALPGNINSTQPGHI